MPATSSDLASPTQKTRRPDGGTTNPDPPPVSDITVREDQHRPSCDRTAPPPHEPPDGEWHLSPTTTWTPRSRLLYFLETHFYYAFCVYIISVVLLGALLFRVLGVRDGLYHATSCVSQAGLATTYWPATPLSAQLVSLVLMFLGCAPLLALAPVWMRRYNFEKQVRTWRKIKRQQRARGSNMITTVARGSNREHTADAPGRADGGGGTVGVVAGADGGVSVAGPRPPADDISASITPSTHASNSILSRVSSGGGARQDGSVTLKDALDRGLADTVPQPEDSLEYRALADTVPQPEDSLEYRAYSHSSIMNLYTNCPIHRIGHRGTVGTGVFCSSMCMSER